MNRIDNLLKSAFAGIKFAFNGIQVLLATTTGIAGYALGRHFSTSLTDGLQFWVGLVFAIFFVIGIDGGLDRFFKVLTAKEKPIPYFWIGAIILTLGTGTFTWFSAAIIGDMESSYITVDDQQQQINEARDEKQSDISDIAQTVRSKKNKIAELEYKMKKDTAAILATFRDSHLKLYKSGQYKKYRNNSRYATLNASVDRLNEVMAPYQKEIASIKASVNDLEGRHTDLLTKDVESNVSEAIAAYNERIARKENNRIGLVKFLDIAGVVFLWILFWGIRHMTLKDKIESDVEGKDFLKWGMDWVTRLQKKALETDTKLDDAAVSALASIIKLLNSILYLFSFILNLIVQLLTWVTTLGKQTSENTASKMVEIGEEKTVVQIANHNPISTNETRTVVQPFQRRETGEDSVEKNKVQPVQPPLPTMVEQLKPVENRVMSSTSENTTKVVELSPKIKSSTPAKVQPKKTIYEVVEIIRGESGKVLVELDRGDRVEKIDISTVQRRKGSWKSKRSTAKTELGRSNAKRWHSFYADLEQQMKVKR